MKVVYEAIMDLAGADMIFDATMTGGLHLQQQEQQTVNEPTYPYATFFKVTQVPEYTFTELGENMTVQFDVFDNSSSVETISDAAVVLKDCFDLASLVVDGYDHIFMKREWETEPMSVNGVRQISIQYRLTIQKSR